MISRPLGIRCEGVKRIDGWNHDVGISVYDEGRLGDVLEFAKSLSSHFPPFGEHRLLGLHRLRGVGQVDVVLAKMTSFPEGPCRRPGLGRQRDLPRRDSKAPLRFDGAVR